MGQSLPISVLRENLTRFTELFADFQDDEIDSLASVIHPVSLKPEQYLFYEGSSGDNLYLLLEGQMGVEKNGHLLTKVNPGSYLGEISLLDAKPRSASIYAVGSSKVYALNVAKLKQLYPQTYAKLIINLAKSLPDLVRKTSETATLSLKNEMALVRQQNEMGRFLTYIMVVLAVFIVAMRYVQELDGVIHDITYIRLTLVLAFVVSILAIKSGQSFSRLGLNLTNAWRSVREALWFSVVVAMLALVAKIYWIRLHPELNESLFEISQHHSRAEWISLFAFCIYAPLQEFIARGCIQSAFAQFFKDRFATVRAIVLSNLLFCSFYTNLNLKFALLLFVLGLGWGWLYSRHASLIGVAISHTLLAMWISVILGFPVELR